MSGETRFSLRLPADLHALLIERAAAEHRSLNAQIIHLLWQAFVVDADSYRAARSHVGRLTSRPLTSRRDRVPAQGTLMAGLVMQR